MIKSDIIQLINILPNTSIDSISGWRRILKLKNTPRNSDLWNIITSNINYREVNQEFTISNIKINCILVSSRTRKIISINGT